MPLEFTPFAEGIFQNLPAEVYHKAPGCSHTMTRHMEPPSRLPVYLAKEHKPTAAQILGTLVHHKILTPDVPFPRLVVPPLEYPAPSDSSLVKSKKVAVGDMVKWSWNAKYCKAWGEKQEAAGNIILTESELATIDGIVSAVANHPKCREAFAEGFSEVSAFKNHQTPDGREVLRKARFDWVPKFGNTLVDLKSCADSSFSAFQRSMSDNGYDTQAASYMRLWNDLCGGPARDCFIFIAVEKVPPYDIQFFQPDSAWIESATEKYFRRLNEYAACARAGIWPGSPAVINIVPEPPYERIRRDQELKRLMDSAAMEAAA